MAGACAVGFSAVECEHLGGRPRRPFRCQRFYMDAGWSPDVERWESDEDSDDSGDEREGDEQEMALSEAAILRLMA